MQLISQRLTVTWSFENKRDPGLILCHTSDLRVFRINKHINIRTVHHYLMSQNQVILIADESQLQTQIRFGLHSLVDNYIVQKGRDIDCCLPVKLIRAF